jgi:predicted methyltransferase
MSFRIKLPAVLAALAITACSGEPPEASLDSSRAQGGPDTGGQYDFDLADARAILANPHRRDGARQRDPLSKPEVILGLLDLQSGQRVLVILGGSGYYADILRGVVGGRGEVILHNNAQYHGYFKNKVHPAYLDKPIAGITYIVRELDELQLGPSSLDAALMINSYHDLYVFDPQRGWVKNDVPAFFAQLHAALKSGGKLLIVDHAAEPGTGNTAPQQLHRIDEEFAKQDIASHGFRLVTASDALRNPEDQRTDIVSDSEFRGKTDRFILLFEKVE